MIIREFDVLRDICIDVEDAIAVHDFIMDDMALYVDEHGRVWSDSDFYIADTVDGKGLNWDDVEQLGACQVNYVKRVTQEDVW